MTRTTLRLDDNLKREAELKALRDNTTLQKLFNEALAQYLESSGRNKARKIVFRTHDLGEALDNLSRGDYYPEPTLDGRAR